MRVATLTILLASAGPLPAADWPQPAGPHHNWQVEGEAPLLWSATRNESIRWRTPMPEAGMSSVTISGNRLFTTTHVPIETLEEKDGVMDIIGLCLDADTGAILWQVTLPGSVFISLAGGFTDGTVFGPIADDERVWFFNRCGSMGCYDHEGNQLLWGKGHPDNHPTNARGFEVGDKGNTGTGWGHISAASPIRVGRLLYWPVVTGTVYVIDATAPELTPTALKAVNDLGPGGETWTLASLSCANGRLYAHTMREIICIAEVK